MTHNHAQNGFGLQKVRDLAQKLSRDENAEVIVYSVGVDNGYQYAIRCEVDIPEEFIEDVFTNGYWSNK